jgi:hypothetical protein
MSFENHIKEWVTIDNKLKILNSTLKDLRSERNNLGEEIIQYVETNNLNHATVKISDGQLRFTQMKQTAPLTLTYVNQCLKDCIGSEETVQKIMKYIKEKRDAKYIPDIKRSYAKTE